MERPDFWVIGIGASAGGLEALTDFFRHLPSDIPASFVIAQHLAPHAKSMMVELLARHTELPVVQVKDHLEIKPGVISIVPPNYDVTASGDELRLTRAGSETRPKPSVDTLFLSLARVYRDKSVGIILSGTGSDGSEGVRAIKESGGLIFVQDPDNAKYDGMPRAAIETGGADAILSTDMLAGQLPGLLRKEAPLNQAGPSQEMTSGELKEIVNYLKKESGADFSQYKMSTIQRRIEKRILTLKFSSYDEYFTYLKEHQPELAALAQNMLVSVTSFFRDKEAFDALSKVLEELILSKKSGENLRIWCAGCATGEEAYTLAILVNELQEKTGKLLTVKIFATDLDYEALAVARSGLYSVDDVKPLDPRILSKYFEKKNSLYEVKKLFRDSVVFARQDLIQNPPFVKLDLVSCRNVLIYFDSSLQSRVFDVFHYALAPGGYLFLGKSETANPNLFSVVDRKEKVFRRLESVSRPLYQGRYAVGLQLQAGLSKKKSPTPLSEIAPFEILREFNLSGVVVDEETTILHVVGDVSQYIKVPAGSADFRLSNLLSKNIAIELSILLKKVRNENITLKSRGYTSEEDDDHEYSIRVRPLKKEENSKPLFIIMFEPRKKGIEVALPKSSEGQYTGRLLELEAELAHSKENLQTVIEELEVSNEELQSLNEELSSANEELQASNEELETTNEELQSTNEELMTLNEELSIKSSELRSAYLNLDNIQTSITFPLIVVDRDLKVQRFNPSANLIFSLSANEIGSAITRASCNCEIPDFEKNLRETVTSGVVTESLCNSNGRVYQLRIHPARDESRKIIGAILVFFDNTDFMQTRNKLEVTDRRLRSIVDGSPTLITMKDTQGRYLTANKAFCDFFRKTEDEVLGKTDRELFEETFSGEIRENDLEVMLKRTPSEIEEKIFYLGKEYHLRTNRFPLFGLAERTPYAIGTVSLNVTDQVKAKEALEISESRYRAMIQEQAVFVCRFDLQGRLLYGNDAFTKVFGPETNRPFKTLLSGKDQESATREVKKVGVDLPIIQIETRSPVQGQERWVRWIIRGIFSSEQVLSEYQAVGIDVTEVHNQTSELLAKENLFTHVLEHTSDYLSVYRFEGEKFILEAFNQSAASNRGFGSQRLIGKEIADLFDPSQAENIITRFRRSVKTGKLDTFEEVIHGPGGDRYLSTTIVPIYDKIQDVTRVVGLSRDITKLKRIETDLREEKLRAESANLAKSDFLASMSHELRTPLNVILGMSQLLVRGIREPRHLKLVESIQRSGKVLLSLIEDVLDLSKIEAGKITFDSRPIDMDQLTGDVIHTFTAEAEKKNLNLHRNFSVEPNIPLIGDEVRIKQILMNLIGNAIKFTEFGGVELSVRLSSRSSGKSEIYFEVKDTGIGIPEEARPKIFQRFSQADSGTSRKYGGTGLGLAISKQLVQLMDGSIGFESQEGSGSTFWFKIELPEAYETLEEYKPEVLDINFSSIKILAVDDNPESLKVLRYFFEEKGAEIHCAESGAVALEKLDSERFDLVLMDMQMPVMDGLQTTKKIRERWPGELPVIALTANAHEDDRKRCLEAGMNDYLTKPIDFDVLKQVLTRWVKHELH